MGVVGAAARTAALCAGGQGRLMSEHLFDHEGRRKYRNANERTAFLAAARCACRETATLCNVIAFTGANCRCKMYFRINDTDSQPLEPPDADLADNTEYQQRL